MICPNNVLLSGPAGADKSAEARRLLAENSGLAIAADFQSPVRRDHSRTSVIQAGAIHYAR